MKSIIVTVFFKFAHQGIHVEEFEPSDEPRETTDECADLAVDEGWADYAPADSAAVQTPATGLDRGEAPETRDAARQPLKNKAAA